MDPYRRVRGKARGEYAYWLRSQGLKFREVGEHLGVTLNRARQLVERGWMIDKYDKHMERTTP